MSIPRIDPGVVFSGISTLRSLNTKTLREMKRLLVVSDNGDPLAVIMPFRMFMEMQGLIESQSATPEVKP